MLLRINDITGDFDCAWEALEGVVRTRFLNDDVKNKGYSLVPDDVGSERQGICDVVEEHVWRILEFSRFLIVDVNLRQIITLWVNELWEVVLKDFTDQRLE